MASKLRVFDLRHGQKVVLERGRSGEGVVGWGGSGVEVTVLTSRRLGTPLRPLMRANLGF
ncbi:hypothetical protein [Streptomyces sp. NPDC048266]|uniref:hypothetical protein n=1 Tax=Streptomyces sp. NPDC048266 TaxID=3155787 RepID=UPI0033CA811A